uniref:Uncharacterized protein n=1 Tax=Setaria viridis TaxID=4556 RepID=A0A4U6VAL3_SETVI|nr:hypothetical protein SEVIR_3G185200v2 [Setaria viridis]
MCKVKCICRYNIEVVPCSLPCADLKQTNVLTRFVLVKQTASQLETNSSELRLLPAFLQKTADTNVQQQVNSMVSVSGALFSSVYFVNNEFKLASAVNSSLTWCIMTKIHTLIVNEMWKLLELFGGRNQIPARY